MNAPKQRRHEAPEIGAMIGRMLNALIRRAAEGDWEALEALAEIERTAPAATTAALCLARKRYSLAELARVMGVTRSAVSQRTTRDFVWDHEGTPGCGHPACVGVRRCRALSPRRAPRRATS